MQLGSALKMQRVGVSRSETRVYQRIAYREIHRSSQRAVVVSCSIISRLAELAAVLSNFSVGERGTAEVAEKHFLGDVYRCFRRAQGLFQLLLRHYLLMVTATRWHNTNRTITVTYSSLA